MEKIWKIKQPNPILQKEISRTLEIPKILAQLLVNRGIASVSEAADFLRCDLASLHDPWLLKGMKKAVARIRKALSCGEQMMVWGDYDIDGITSTALLVSVLEEMGGRVWHYLPNRLEEGYGLNKKGAEEAKRKGVRLLITVDCGISAEQQISHLKQLGIETIVCDHHQPRPGASSCAWAIINPLQKGCAYPYKHLAGVGLALKLACALTDNPQNILEQHLDIVALGTVGDIVPLTGENRILVKHGLETFQQTNNLGLQALIEASGLNSRVIKARDLGYILGPRINASGRLGSPEDSLKLLLAQQQEEAEELAQKLNQGNRLRQRIEQKTLQQAIEQVERQINFKEHNIIVLGAPDWHQGVIGIVASRLVERYLRPTIMLSLRDGFGRGSGRSLGNFHLLEAVTRCADLLEEYGGHRRACGIKLKKDRLDEFFQTINRVAGEMLRPEDLISTLDIDAQIPLAQLTIDLIKQLELLSPFGSDNPQPIICSAGLKVRTKASVVAGNHLKFWVTDGGLTCEVIGYNKAGVFPELKVGQDIKLAYTPSINNWQGNISLQLKLEDLKIAHGDCFQPDT